MGKPTRNVLEPGGRSTPLGAPEARRRRRPSLLAAAALLAVAALLAGCGSSSTTTSSSSPTSSSAPSTPSTPSSTPSATTATSEGGLSGKWKGQYSGTYNGSFVLDWTQSGSGLSGTITLSSPPGTLSLHGVLHGSTITFGTVGSVAITYTGTVSGSSMSGSYSTPNGGGSWSATKS